MQFNGMIPGSTRGQLIEGFLAEDHQKISKVSCRVLRSGLRRPSTESSDVLHSQGSVIIMEISLLIHLKHVIAIGKGCVTNNVIHVHHRYEAALADEETEGGLRRD